jgi:hypothetical protein
LLLDVGRIGKQTVDGYERRNGWKQSQQSVEGHRSSVCQDAGVADPAINAEQDVLSALRRDVGRLLGAAAPSIVADGVILADLPTAEIVWNSLSGPVRLSRVGSVVGCCPVFSANRPGVTPPIIHSAGPLFHGLVEWSDLPLLARRIPEPFQSASHLLTPA